ncbi:probable WRKY transcription factor 40 isoform X6 [Rhodamnia argentea]|uniref:Probable WRKY transcription factor 40 isoform X6 n=1 Tax=Rhodamnia argentea TaxID=178133 RepID=A0ABM3H977_9MYRT|nr:probable WRKY transcription factor 40 isoform X6 [Rhodamnia argentea]
MSSSANPMESNWIVDTSLELNTSYPKKEIGPRNDNSQGGRQEEPVVKHEAGALVDEYHRISHENRKLTEMLALMHESYNALHNQLIVLGNKTSSSELGVSRKRKHEASVAAECCSYEEDQIFKEPKDSFKPKISKIHCKTDVSDISLVQRRADDPSVLAATYEGEHNHLSPSQIALCSDKQGLNLGSPPIPSPLKPRSSSPRSTPDLMHPGFDTPSAKTGEETEAVTTSQQFLVQQMVSSLKRDPNFTGALAAAISGRILDQARIEKW